MSSNDIKLAEKAFRAAIIGHAVQFDLNTVRRAESLLLKARSLANSDPAKSKILAKDAQQIALEAIAKTQTKRSRLKDDLGIKVNSLLQEISIDKKALSDIRKRINAKTYLIISQRMVLAEACIKKAEEGLQKEQFSAFPELYARTKQRLLDVAQVLTPVLQQLNYSGDFKIPSRIQKIT